MAMHQISSHGDITPVADRQPKPRPRVRRVAVIRTDASGFKLVAAPSERSLRRH